MNKVIIGICILVLFSCSNEINQENITYKTIKINAVFNKDTIIVPTPINYEKVDIQTRNTPHTDSTNFDDYNSKNLLSESNIDSLHLNYVKEQLGYSVPIYYNYQLNLSDNFKTMVFLFLSENVLKSVLINYDFNGNLIDFIEVAYDELVKSWSRTTSEIYNDKIVITNVLWFDEKREAIKEYIILNNGELILNLNKFKNNIRPNNYIKAGGNYIDTVVFLDFEDGGDYRNINVKTNNKVTRLVYNWDSNDTKPYSFRKGDTLQIKWSIDTVYIAGDDERLDYTEWAIDAIKL